MEIAFGPLSLTPDTFWRMSWVEWEAAISGVAIKNGHKSLLQPSKAEAADIVERGEAFLAKRNRN